MKRQFLVVQISQVQLKKHTIKANFPGLASCPGRLHIRKTKLTPQNKVITQCTQYRPCYFRGPIKQFKRTEHTLITGVATTGLDTLSASPRNDPGQTAYIDLVNWCHSTPPSGLLWGPVLSPVGSGALKHVFGGCPINAQSDSSLGVAVATPWRRCLPAPARLVHSGRVRSCLVVHQDKILI